MDGRPSEITAPDDPNGSLESVILPSAPTPRPTGKGRLVRRVIGILLTLTIFAWIFKPIILHWSDVKDRIHHTSLGRILFASLIFSIFLFVFRALTWRRILIGFGYRLPIAPTVRIWSSSELSRYLPGVIWQVVSRIYARQTVRRPR